MSIGVVTQFITDMIVVFSKVTITDYPYGHCNGGLQWWSPASVIQVGDHNEYYKLLLLGTQVPLSGHFIFLMEMPFNTWVNGPA